MNNQYLCRLCDKYTHVDLKYIYSFSDNIKVRCNFCNVILSERANRNCTWDLEASCGAFIIESVNTLSHPSHWTASSDYEDTLSSFTAGIKLFESLKNINKKIK